MTRAQVCMRDSAPASKSGSCWPPQATMSIDSLSLLRIHHFMLELEVTRRLLQAFIKTTILVGGSGFLWFPLW